MIAEQPARFFAVISTRGSAATISITCSTRVCMSAAAAHTTDIQTAGRTIPKLSATTWVSYLLQDSTAAQSYLQGASKDCPVKSVRAALHLAGR
eukprot:COSAG06_NODE_34995_length_466_cov_0.836512_2_plen_93_part_01